MMRHWSLGLCLALTSFLVWGCADDGGDAGGGAGGAGGGAGGMGGGAGGGAGGAGGGGMEGCVSDIQCGEGRVCVGAGANAMCRPGDCNREKSCPAGQTCDPNTFRCSGSMNDACMNDVDCEQRGGGLCDDGICRDVQCLEDGQCEVNEECNEQNRCVARLMECLDADMDGYGEGCDPGPDCDDNNAMVNPGVMEDANTLCGDGVDNDCNGTDPTCGEVDADMDGVSPERGDCDDNDPMVNPNAVEVPYNGKDDDCDEETRDDDLDGDGYPRDEDCDDRAGHINPEARDIPGDGIDQDCDGMDRMAEPVDRDGDGVTEADGDCDDDNVMVNPNAMEVPYNGVDDDCNAATRDNDLDMDGFNTPEDCDDNNAMVNPNIRETYYNNVDDDCDPETNDSDRDGDGVNGMMAGGNDCNDENPQVNPMQEEVQYNGADDDCDPMTRDDDIDNDGFSRDDECNDNDPNVNPDVVENADMNCDDSVDNDCRGGDVPCGVPIMDRDMDGVPDDMDCAPDNAMVPGQREIPNNGIDDDCNPMTPDMCDDDPFDNMAGNDDQLSATGVQDGNRRGVQYGGLTLCSGDEDWYRIQVAEGDGLEVDISFIDEMGDLDMQLLKAGPNGELQVIDSSVSVGDEETVYERRATANAVYFIRIYGYRGAFNDYGMTVNVFSQCIDDVESFNGGEQNDSAARARRMPPPAETRQVCDYDDDWFNLEVEEAGDYRIDVLFPDRDGDVDVEVYRDGENRPFIRETSGSDDEVVDARGLQPGTYKVRVYGVGDDTNTYRIMTSTGGTGTEEREKADGIVQIPDRMGDVNGRAEVQIQFQNAPAGALIRRLRIRDMFLEHEFLRDLRITAQWDGEERAVVWNRLGGRNDAGEDDDVLPDLGRPDIDLDDRRYRGFEGLPARGTFTLVVEDLARNDTGFLETLEVDIEYIIP